MAATRTATASERASALANDVRRLARRRSRDDIAERIGSEASRWAEPGATLVVVGEAAAGKTRLVAALTGRPDVFEAAHTPAVTRIRGVSAAADERVVTHRDGISRTMDVEGYLALGAGSSGDHGGVPELIELELVAPRLIDHLTIVDTPALADLGAPSTRATTAASSIADALIVVADGSAPLSAVTGQAVAALSSRFAELTFVVTGTDRSRGWRQLLGDGTSVLERLPVAPKVTAFGVSAKLAEIAFVGALDDDERDDLLLESGLPELQDHLALVVRQVRTVRLLNLLRVIGRAVDDLDDECRTAIAAAGDGAHDEVGQRLDATRRLLVELRDEGASWLTGLSDAMAQLREEAIGDLQRRLVDFAARSEQTIASARLDPEAFAEDVRRDLALVADELTQVVADRLAELIAELQRRSELAELGVEVRPLELADLVERSAPRPSGTADGGRLKVAGSVVSAATSSSMLVQMLGGGGALDGGALIRIGALGAAAMFSTVVAGLTVRSGRTNRTRDRLRGEMKAAIDALRSDGPPKLRAHLLSVQRSIEQQIKRQLRERSAVVERQISELQAGARADAVDRRRNAARAEEERQQLAHTRTQLELLVTSLTNGDGR